MKGDRTVYSAVKSASRVSKRDGNWANQTEITTKIQKPFGQPVRPILSSLHKRGIIQEKGSMWRPKADTASGGSGKSRGYDKPTRGNDRGDTRGDKPTRGNPTHRERKGTRRTTDAKRTLARGMVSGGVTSSITRTIF